MKNIELTKLRAGAIFNYGGLDWLKLDEAGGTVKAISKSIVEKRAFDEDNHNDWRRSSLRKYLNDEFLNDLLDNGANELDFIDIESDLTTDDGLTAYGTAIDKITLITCNDYRKYRSLLEVIGEWWWTITADSQEPTSNSYHVRYVGSGGTLNSNIACYGSKGVRPLCNLSSQILVSITDEEYKKLDPKAEEKELINNPKTMIGQLETLLETKEE